jgi:hypothetical protein
MVQVNKITWKPTITFYYYYMPCWQVRNWLIKLQIKTVYNYHSGNLMKFD